jgi:hypothetical protein
MRRAPAIADLAAVLALDLGTFCGWALRVDGRLESGVQEFSLKRGESPGMRYVAFNRWLREIATPLLDSAADGRLALIAYEAAHHRGGAATEVANGFTTRVQEHCARWQFNHVSVHSATLKKWVSGHGQAKKQDIAEAVERRGWLPAGTHASALTDDELDAIGLLHYVEAVVLGAK